MVNQSKVIARLLRIISNLIKHITELEVANQQWQQAQQQQQQEQAQEQQVQTYRIFLADSNKNITREITSLVNSNEAIELLPDERYVIFKGEGLDALAYAMNVRWSTIKFEENQVVIKIY